MINIDQEHCTPLVVYTFLVNGTLTLSVFHGPHMWMFVLPNTTGGLLGALYGFQKLQRVRPLLSFMSEALGNLHVDLAFSVRLRVC